MGATAQPGTIFGRNGPRSPASTTGSLPRTNEIGKNVDHLLFLQGLNSLIDQTGAARSDPGLCQSRHTLLTITTDLLCTYLSNLTVPA